MKSRPLAALALVLGALACAKSPPPAPAADAKAGRDPDCMNLPAVRLYLEDVRKATIAKWEVPEGSAGHRSMLRIMLDGNGRILNSSVVGAPRDPANVAALRALDAAAPFGPIPEAASCLDHGNITVTFVAPEAPQVGPGRSR